MRVHRYDPWFVLHVADLSLLQQLLESFVSRLPVHFHAFGGPLAGVVTHHED